MAWSARVMPFNEHGLDELTGRHGAEIVDGAGLGRPLGVSETGGRAF